MVTKTENLSEGSQKGNRMSNERTCPVSCEKHDIEDCKYYLQQTLEERSKLIFKKKLCYGYFQEIKKDGKIEKKKNNLSMVEDIKIPHCYKSCGF